MEIFINEKKIKTTQLRLKQELENFGMNFPCDGKGICGRCKVICKDLSPTNLDKRFLTDIQIDEGIRLACDKQIKDNIKVFFTEEQKSQRAKKLEYCNIVVVVDNQKITIGILEDEIVEEHFFENNINESSNKKVYLRSLLAKESIELFEKYGVAKADTIAVALNQSIAEQLVDGKADGFGDMLDALEFMLPAETLYVLPFVDNHIGGDFLSFAAIQKPQCIAIKADTDFVAALIDVEEVICLKHHNVSYTDSDIAAISASIKLLLKNVDKTPIFKVYGKDAQKLNGVLDGYTYAIEDEDIIIKTVASTIDDNRLKNKIYKLRKKISVLQTAENEEWHKQFVLSANNGDNRHNSIF